MEDRTKWRRKLSEVLFAPKESAKEPKPTSPQRDLPSSPKEQNQIQNQNGMVSVLVPQSSDQILQQLDAKFFTESFDPVAYMLQNLPDDKNSLSEFLQTEISAVDLARDVIVSKLADDVRLNHNAFIQGMRQVQEVDLDIVRAQIHVKNGRRLLQSAKNELVNTSFQVIKTKRYRDRLGLIIDICCQIKFYFEQEESMNKALESDAFITAVDICLALRQDLLSSDLRSVRLLRKVQKRVENFIPELRERFDQSLRRVAEHFDPCRYKELIQAYITLADYAESLGTEFSASFEGLNVNDMLLSIPEIVVRSIDEMTRDFLRTSCDTGGNQTKQPTAVTTGTNNPARRSSNSVSATTEKILAMVRCFEQFTELLHNYYLLVQWHRDPFNVKNDNIMYLHRCGIDDDDDDDDDEEEEDEEDEEEDHEEDEIKSDAGPTSPTGSVQNQTQSPRRVIRRRSSLSCQPSNRKTYSLVLCETGMKLLRYRKIVWDNMQQIIIEMLERLDLSHVVKMEHIIAFSQAMTAFVEIGEEFTGAPSSTLRSVMNMKAEQYLRSFHDDNMELMRMLLDTENWQRIQSPNDLPSDGMLQLLEKRSGYSFNNDKRCALVSRPLFQSFHVQGNPFASMNCSKWLYTMCPDRFQPKPAGSLADKRRALLARKPPIFSPQPGSDGQEPSHGDQDGSENNDHLVEWVFTSSTLSGFVRLCGVYLKMMEYIPVVAWDAFLLLNKIFEFNVYTTFTTFVSKDYLTALLKAHPSTTGSKAASNPQSSSSTSAASMDAIKSKVFLFRASTFEFLRRRMLEIGSELSRMHSPKRTPNGGAGVGGIRCGNDVLRREIRVPLVIEQADELNLFGVAERSTACEAIQFQMDLLNAMEPLVKRFIPNRFLCVINEQYTGHRDLVQEMRSFVYASIGSELTDARRVPGLIMELPWMLDMVSDRHSDYVTSIVRKCGVFFGSLQVASGGSIALEAREEIWNSMVENVLEALLEGYCRVEHCTPQGRSLMVMDVHAIMNGLELINHVRRNPWINDLRVYMTDFLKSFYMEEDDLIKWIQQHKNSYRPRHIAYLVKNGVVLPKTKKGLNELVKRIQAGLTD